MGDVWSSKGLDQHPPVFEKRRGLKNVPRQEPSFPKSYTHPCQVHGWDGGDPYEGRLQDFGKGFGLNILAALLGKMGLLSQNSCENIVAK